MTRRQRERAAWVAAAVPLDHTETADLLVEIARAGDRSTAEVLLEDDEWSPEVGDVDALVARLADVVDEGPTDLARAVAVDLLARLERRGAVVLALRRALRQPCFAVRAHALYALAIPASTVPCGVTDYDLVLVLRDLVANAPPDALHGDEGQEEDERMMADAVIASLAHVQPAEAEEALLDLIDAEHDAIWLDAGWATEALAAAFPETAAAMVDHWLKCARSHERVRALAALERLPLDLAEPRLRLPAPGAGAAPRPRRGAGSGGPGAAAAARRRRRRVGRTEALVARRGAGADGRRTLRSDRRPGAVPRPRPIPRARELRLDAQARRSARAGRDRARARRARSGARDAPGPLRGRGSRRRRAARPGYRGRATRPHRARAHPGPRRRPRRIRSAEPRRHVVRPRHRRAARVGDGPGACRPRMDSPAPRSLDGARASVARRARHRPARARSRRARSRRDRRRRRVRAPVARSGRTRPLLGSGSPRPSCVADLRGRRAGVAAGRRHPSG